MVRTYVCGGKLGDLLHSMWVVKRQWEADREKGVVVLSGRFGGDAFSRGLRGTYEEVRELLEGQEYVDRVELDEGCWAPPEGTVNLSAWRQSRYVSSVDWTTMLSRVYGLERVDPVGGWLRVDREARTELVPGVPLKDLVVVHQSYRTRVNGAYPWERILRNNNCIFVTCNRLEYDDFSGKAWVSCYVARDLMEMAEIVAGAKAFCGNQSAPLALAVALGKTCYCQLYCVDRLAYVGLGSHVYYDDVKPTGDTVKIP
jgi:hypothetical protein